MAAAEECDDQNAVEDDGCKNDCTFFVSATCNDLLTNASVWGLVSTGVDLVPWTSSQLDWIGCPGNGCIPGSFYCTYDVATQQLDFGTTSTSAMRSLVDPGNGLGDIYPETFDNNCCSAPGGLCNAPDSANNGVAVDMVAALCTALGYSGGMVLREESSNFCPEPHAVDADGQQWDSDFIDSDGFGAEYRCTGFL